MLGSNAMPSFTSLTSSKSRKIRKITNKSQFQPVSRHSNIPGLLKTQTLSRVMNQDRKQKVRRPAEQMQSKKRRSPSIARREGGVDAAAGVEDVEDFKIRIKQLLMINRGKPPRELRKKAIQKR